ncbi:kinetoplast-associated protein-like protein [Diplonema papillatum]|nr:kinetoplast-associated protein-like protein [Diplonema papillatum]
MAQSPDEASAPEGESPSVDKTDDPPPMIDPGVSVQAERGSAAQSAVGPGAPAPPPAASEAGGGQNAMPNHPSSSHADPGDLNGRAAGEPEHPGEDDATAVEAVANGAAPEKTPPRPAEGDEAAKPDKTAHQTAEVDEATKPDETAQQTAEVDEAVKPEKTTHPTAAVDEAVKPDKTAPQPAEVDKAAKNGAKPGKAAATKRGKKARQTADADKATKSDSTAHKAAEVGNAPKPGKTAHKPAEVDEAVKPDKTAHQTAVADEATKSDETAPQSAEVDKAVKPDKAARQTADADEATKPVQPGRTTDNENGAKPGFAAHKAAEADKTTKPDKAAHKAAEVDKATKSDSTAHKAAEAGNAPKPDKTAHKPAEAEKAPKPDKTAHKPAEAEKAPKPDKTAHKPVEADTAVKPDKAAPPAPAAAENGNRDAAAAAAAAAPTPTTTTSASPHHGSTSPRRTSLSRASPLSVVLRVPPAAPHQRLWVTCPGRPAVEGKFYQPQGSGSAADAGGTTPRASHKTTAEPPPRPRWVNPSAAEIRWLGDHWVLAAAGGKAGEARGQRGAAAAVLKSEECAPDAMPSDVRWKRREKDGSWVLDDAVLVENKPGTYAGCALDIPVVGDSFEFETVIAEGVNDLEMHINSCQKAGYTDNVGSMYRLQRTSECEQRGESRPFDIHQFLKFVYEADGLGWTDGKPAVLAAMIYVDRIRAHGRVISRRSVHRILLSAMLIGHEYFAALLRESGEPAVEPPPVAQLASMVSLSPENVEPLIARFKGMMDFEDAVLEHDVTTYVGALKGGVELSAELEGESKKERAPGQQGLSSRKDGMGAIRRWIDESLISCHSSLQLSPTDPRLPPAAKPPTALAASQLGGSAYKAAVQSLLKAHARATSVTRLRSRSES